MNIVSHGTHGRREARGLILGIRPRLAVLPLITWNRLSWCPIKSRRPDRDSRIHVHQSDRGGSVAPCQARLRILAPVTALTSQLCLSQPMRVMELTQSRGIERRQREGRLAFFGRSEARCGFRKRSPLPADFRQNRAAGALSLPETQGAPCRRRRAPTSPSLVLARKGKRRDLGDE